MSAALVLKDFNGVIEVTPDAYQLKKHALAVARPIHKVETGEEQLAAVAALRELKEIRHGMEATRKAVKAPVLDLGRRIDATAQDFLEDCYKQEGRIQGLINHYQRKELEKKREEEKKLEREAEEAKRLRDRANNTDNPILKAELESAAFDLEMSQEVAVVPGVEKPKGLVVKARINFQVIDPIVFCQAWPDFWKWHADTETLKIDRMLILDELNKENGNGVFHKTKFPEELSATDDPRLVRPAGLRVYEETKTHVR